MLQRAASNACSWWWASHIRTKQSKWLEQSLQDMEEKVQYVLKLIQEDGDSFAKRAEMYYKKRPELISFVEESYRAFRALADRYNNLSAELQNANTTIASVFPDQVPFDMDDGDGYGPPKMPKNLPRVSGQNVPQTPKLPKAPNKDLKGLLTIASKKLQEKKSAKTDHSNHIVPNSGLTKNEALKEMDLLQKDILAMQTVKEFMKSSYESGLAKYWEIENKIMEKQQKVCSLQDEFFVGTVIEDDEARTLMAEAALKSCQETLAQLQEKQDTSTQEARAEYKRIEDARQKLKSLKREFLPNIAEEEKLSEKDEIEKAEEKLQSLNQEGKELEMKIKENLSNESLTVTELAETIDQLVNKVISLESSVSSQTALIDRLRTETDDLQTQIQTLEDDKDTLIHGTHNLSNRLKEMEEKLHGVQDINQNVENQNTNLQTHFTEARSSLDHLSEKLQSVKPDDEELELTGSLQEEKRSLVETKSRELEKPKDIPCSDDDLKISNSNISPGDKQIENVKEADDKSEKCKVVKPEDEVEKQELSHTEDSLLNTESQEAEAENEERLNWQQMLLSGSEDKEKIQLTEYTTILKKYKDVKKKLSEVETKNQGSLFEMTVQVREMKTAIAKRDHEIQSLRQKLSLVQELVGENKDLKEENWPEDIPPAEKEEEDINVILMNQPQTISVIEEKLRKDIDAILDENLDFWLRFSTAFHEVQKFKTEIDDLQAEIAKLKAVDGKISTSLFTTDVKSDARPIYKHLREKQTELTVWLEKSVLLKDELQSRCSSLSNIQEEITTGLREGVEEEEIKFSSHQAAKFQGEVLNMQQENNKVNKELQAGLDHVAALQLETEKTLAKLDEEFGLSESKNQNQAQLGQSASPSGIPLRSFIFGVKPKKQKQSIFACMHHPRKYTQTKLGLSM